MIRLFAALALVLMAAPAFAVECEDISFAKRPYAICKVDLATEDLRLFLNNGEGAAFGKFAAVNKSLSNEEGHLSFAMNAGMYHPDRAPVGHYVENGVEKMRIIPNAGPGNFGLLPNGIFCIRDGRADVIETLAFVKMAPDCRYATQSGPMLVIDGQLHPRFLVDSTSRYIRNGVGTTLDGKTAIFAISNRLVTFHEFGTLFRDYLKTPNALFFDGNVSQLYAPQLRRSDRGRKLGPIVGVVSAN